MFALHKEIHERLESKTKEQGILRDNQAYLKRHNFFFFFFLLFRATPVAYGGSQARGQIGVTAASLYHSHSNAGSKLHL